MQISTLETFINELKRIGYPTERIHILPSNCSQPWVSDIQIQTSSGKKLMAQENGLLSLDVVLERVSLKHLQKLGIDSKLWCASSLELLKKVPTREEAVVARHKKL